MSDLPKQIFVIEDDLDIRESIVEVLRADGFEADSAGSSQEAIAKLKEVNPKPYLILLDLRLPGQDGFQFRETQKQTPEIADIPVVILSADAQLQEKMQRMGAIDLLRKPVDIDELLETVRRNCIA